MKTTKTNKWSKNAKLNALLSEIEDDLRSMCDSEEESLEEIRRYMQEFPKEKDYNLVNYGNLLVYFVQVRDLYKRCGYEIIDRINNTVLWETYRRQVGYVAREIMKMH